MNTLSRCIRVKRGPKNWTLSWGDGGLNEVQYLHLAHLFKAHGVHDALRAEFHQAREQLPRDSTLISGGSPVGCWTKCPADIATRVLALLSPLYAAAEAAPLHREDARE